MKAEQKAIEAVLADLEAVKGKLLKLAEQIGKGSVPGNPFSPDTQMGVVFGAGSGKKYRTLSAILTDAANHPVFLAMKDANGNPLPMGDVNSKPAGRYKRAYWQYTMISSSKHSSNKGRAKCVVKKGQTVKKGHERLVKFVALPPSC